MAKRKPPAQTGGESGSPVGQLEATQNQQNISHSVDLSQDVNLNCAIGEVCSPSGAVAPFPCQNSYNCDSTEGRKNVRGRTLVQLDEGGELWLGGITSQDRKRVYQLNQNAEWFLKKHGLEQCGLLTLTFSDEPNLVEANRRFHNLNRRVLPAIFTDWIVIVEFHRRAVPHYHLLVAQPYDIRTGLDFDAIAAGDYRSANSHLRKMWHDLRQAMPKYGFGRSELLPIRKVGEALAKYVGKYLEKGLEYKGQKAKGMRSVRYGRKNSVRVAWSSFAWVSSGASAWRAFVGQVAALSKCATMDDLSLVHGKSWGYRLQCYLRETGGFPEPLPHGFEDWPESDQMQWEELRSNQPPRLSNAFDGVIWLRQTHPELGKMLRDGRAPQSWLLGFDLRR